MSAADPFAIAERAGIRIEFADFGEGAAGVLVAEYEPHGPVIKVNTRALERAPDALALARHAVAHELYHHREHTGVTVRHKARADRECAAERFAQRMLQ